MNRLYYILAKVGLGIRLGCFGSRHCFKGLFVGMNDELAHPTVGRNNNLCRNNRSVDIAQYGCVCTDGNIN